MTKRISMRAIAEELGLSVPTVSRALGGYTDISAATRARVAEAAKRLGYEPNAAGRMLASGRSGFVGLVLPVQTERFVNAYIGAISPACLRGWQNGICI
ncbi:MAG: LacI family DNA-binding transcriptional regulator [Paracoccus sp. (in: a-proteobacteria)]